MGLHVGMEEIDWCREWNAKETNDRQSLANSCVHQSNQEPYMLSGQMTQDK